MPVVGEVIADREYGRHGEREVDHDEQSVRPRGTTVCPASTPGDAMERLRRRSRTHAPPATMLRYLAFRTGRKRDEGARQRRTLLRAAPARIAVVGPIPAWHESGARAPNNCLRKRP